MGQWASLDKLVGIGVGLLKVAWDSFFERGELSFFFFVLKCSGGGDFEKLIELSSLTELFKPSRASEFKAQDVDKFVQ